MSTDMAARVSAIQALINQGYTVLDAGRELGLTRHQAEYTAQRYRLRALHGAIAEAKSDAGIAGNRARWG